MKIKTSELTGIQLDWAVAVAEELDYACEMSEISGRLLYYAENGEAHLYQPSTDWSLAGPIIEREKIDVVADPNGKNVWMGRAYTDQTEIRCYSPTALIAAMRCYVASKLGNEVEIPEELI